MLQSATLVRRPSNNSFLYTNPDLADSSPNMQTPPDAADRYLITRCSIFSPFCLCSSTPLITPFAARKSAVDHYLMNILACRQPITTTDSVPFPQPGNLPERDSKRSLLSLETQSRDY